MIVTMNKIRFSSAVVRTDNWDGKQKWEIKTSSGKIPEGWEPYAYDTNDEQDPFLLRVARMAIGMESKSGK